MVRAAHSHWPEGHRFKPTGEEHLRKWLQAKAGWHIINTVDTTDMDPQSAIIAIAAEIVAAGRRTGDPIHFPVAAGAKFHIVQSKSIEFNSLPHLEACAVFDAVADTIKSETGLDPDDIMPPIRKSEPAKRELLAEVPL